MAKRTSRSQADDGTPAPPGPKTRGASRSRRTPKIGTETATGQDQAGGLSDTFVGAEPVQSQSPQEATSARSMSSEPSEEDIRIRAYHRYLERGGGHGMDYDDWIEAEKELRNQRENA